MIRFLFFAFTLAMLAVTGSWAIAQTGVERVGALRPNVVAIEVSWGGDQVRNGFGFITGQRGDTVYVATALHVLLGQGPGEEAEDISVRLFDLPGRDFDADMVSVSARSIDLGVVTLDWPEGVAWTQEALAPADRSLAFGDDVWFIGRDLDWYVPARPGAVNQISRLQRSIRLDGLPVRVGSSGAPLLSADGIVGMVIRAGPTDDAEAVPISEIQLAFEEWRLPWQLTAARSPPELDVVDTFRDCDDCPLMVVMPAGSFTMGSTEAERQWAVDQSLSQKRVDREKPQHRVQIDADFAVGQYAVTRGQFARFAQETNHDVSGGCWEYTGEWKENASNDWRSPGFKQTDRDPVVCMSWEDAKAYVTWLSKKTRQPYRLLSEAEWEYAARAGTTTRYSWGDDITPEKANYGRKVGKTSEVGSYPPNPWGLYDMHGNVWEWVEDCWNDSYDGAPSDGSAWTRGDCSRRVLRGGSWGFDPGYLRSAIRSGSDTDFRNVNFGFRIARTLR